MAGGQRDEGMAAAIARAGSAAKLGKLLTPPITGQAVRKMRRCPQDRVFAVAEAARMDPVQLRPDLEDWICQERSRRRMAAAKDRFSLRQVVAAAFAVPSVSAVDELAVDLLVTQAAVRFVAGERALSPARVLAGSSREDQAARAYAMALAHVAGRAKSAAVGVFFGTSRQNVDNASERYLRARDGDDPDDFLDGEARVLERGRVRRAKEAVAELWALEARFTALLEPERKAG